MNSEMQRRLYDMEVTPPLAVWEKLSLNIDEINEDNLVAKRILDIESSPPVRVWEKLSANIDEINGDNRVAKKILSAELTPPAGIWQKIDSTINVAEEIPIQKKGRVINLRRVALAAILIGVIATGWAVFQNFNSNPQGIATVPTKPTQKTSGGKTDTIKGSEQNGSVENPVNVQSPEISTDPSIASIEPRTHSPKTNKSTSHKRRDGFTAQSSPVQFAALNTPLAKSFDRSIDDLSSVTSDQNYLTMVNANGRLVKIPNQLASLAPHLQDKPISEDIYEVMFGEGTYWKETLDEWRKKIASAPVTSGGAFTSFVELLKNVQDR